MQVWNPDLFGRPFLMLSLSVVMPCLLLGA
jgi:hypothetical protein